MINYNNNKMIVYKMIVYKIKYNSKKNKIQMINLIIISNLIL